MTIADEHRAGLTDFTANTPGRIKVCFVVPDFPVLSETFIVTRILGMMDRGFDVTIVCDAIRSGAGVDLSAEPYRRMMPITRLRWPADSAIKAMLRPLRWRLREHASTVVDLVADARLNRYDVILAQFGWVGLRLARASRFGVLRRPFATCLYGLDVAEPYHQRRMSIYRTMFRQKALLLPVSCLFRDLAVAAGADPARTMVLRMGVDCRSIAFSERTWPLADPGPTFITVARLVEKKGIEFAIRAFAQLRTRAPEVLWRYDIIGDGELRPMLEQLAATLGVADRVRFRGPLAHADVQAALRDAHIFLLPSVTSVSGDMEGIPVALTEAMASGLVVISTRHSGIPELVEHGSNGLLAEERDDLGLSHHIEWAALNPAACFALAQAARRTIEHQYDSAALNDRLAEIVRQLAAGERVAPVSR
jgi:colanic acid/amylovoran biosynthesis glycosyltransferase